MNWFINRVWYNWSSAPLSILKNTLVSFNWNLMTQLGRVTFIWRVNCSKKYVSSSELCWEKAYINFLDKEPKFLWLRQALAQCPFLEHFLHIESLAGHTFLRWIFPRQCVHLALSANLLSLLPGGCKCYVSSRCDGPWGLFLDMLSMLCPLEALEGKTYALLLFHLFTLFDFNHGFF